MTTPRLILALLCASLCGCSSFPSRVKTDVQAFLDAALPSDFTGPAHIEHHNPGFDLTIDVTGLNRQADGWHWTGLTYHRQDHIGTWSSRGDVILGAKP